LRAAACPLDAAIEKAIAEAPATSAECDFIARERARNAHANQGNARAASHQTG